MVKATSSGNFKPIPLPKPTTTVARCYSLIDIGTVDSIFQNKLQGKVHLIFLTWELPKFKAVFNEEKGEQPFVVSEEFRLSTKDNSNLAKLVSAWRNKPFTTEEEKGFDPTVMVGKTCLVQIMHIRKKKFKEDTIPDDKITNENTMLKMQSIMKRPEDMPIAEGINPYFVWDWEAIESGKEAFDKEKYESIPNFIKEKMETSEEYKKFASPHMTGGEGQAQTEPQQANSPSGPVTTEDW